MSGRVEFEGMSPKPQGNALPAIPIGFDGEISRIGSLGFPTSAGTQWPGRFDATGAFTSVSLPGGRYYVRVSGGPRGWSFKSAMLNGRDVSEVPLDMSADIGDVIVTFTDQPTELSGIVHTSDGAARSGRDGCRLSGRSAGLDDRGAELAPLSRDPRRQGWRVQDDRTARRQLLHRRHPGRGHERLERAEVSRAARATGHRHPDR